MKSQEIEIKTVESFIIERPFTKEIAHGLATNSRTSNLILRLKDGKGRVGYGEGVPRSYVTGESPAGSFEQLKKYVPEMLVGRAFFPEDVMGFSEDVMHDEFSSEFPSVACALEIALLDLAGKAMGLPCSRFLCRTNRKKAFPLVYSAVLTIIKDPNELKKTLGLIQSLKFKQVKVKLGFEGDMGFLEEINGRLGKDCDIRVDVNGAWSLEQTINNLPVLHELGISCIEEPITSRDPRMWSEIREKSRIPIMADESLCRMDDATTLINHNAVDAVNIKLSKLGGPGRCSEIAQLAQSHGISVQLGCQVGELGILSAAGRHLAAVTPGLIYLEGCLTRFFVQDIIYEDLSPGPGGFAEPLEGPGLGINVLYQELISK